MHPIRRRLATEALARRARETNRRAHRIGGAIFAASFFAFGLLFLYFTAQAYSLLPFGFPHAGLLLLATFSAGCLVSSALCIGEALRD